MSQKSEVLELLRYGGDQGLCLAGAPVDLAYTLRNRVSELRRDGYDIRGERCTRHAHKGPILSYRLVTAPVQMALI